VRALVRADAPRAVVLDPDACEEAAAGADAPVRARVLLLERPQRRLGVADEDALGLPALEHARRVRVRVPVRLRQVDLDDIVRRARDQRGALAGVDDVVGRRHDRLEAADAGRVVVECPEGLDVGHVPRRLAARLVWPPTFVDRYRRTPKSTV
jgi:hypothetical protein